MQILSRVSSLALIAFLTACAQTLPVTVEPATYDAPPPGERLHDLEAAAAQLRQQQLAMGESLTWLEGEIKALHHTDFSKANMTVPTPIVPAAQTVTEEHHNQSGPTTLVPTSPTPAAAVSELSTDDLRAEPTPHARPEPTALAHAARTSAQTPSPTTGYAVHVASFPRSEQLHLGWREIKQRYGAQLGNLRPFGTRFTDSQGRNWTRLNVGPFNTRQAANETCAHLKAAGAFCDVQPVTAGSTSAVQ